MNYILFVGFIVLPIVPAELQTDFENELQMIRVNKKEAVTFLIRKKRGTNLGEECREGCSLEELHENYGNYENSYEHMTWYNCQSYSCSHGCQSTNNDFSHSNNLAVACKVNGGWGNWGSWASCSVSCGGSTQYRSRSCNSPSPYNGGTYCSGSSSDSQSCNTHPCPIDGAWTTWSSWGACTVTCDGGSETRTRTCTNPSPQYGGAHCVGDTEEKQICNTAVCIIDGGWSTWTSWGLCSQTCGTGSKTIMRSCTNPVPANGGQQCSGEHAQYLTCNTDPCPVHSYSGYVQYCAAGWFTCWNGTVGCINATKICDCRDDCGDSSDESTSYAGCEPIQAALCSSTALSPYTWMLTIMGVITILLNTLESDVIQHELWIT